jgi:tetratricopeptide (TPR) repeat protein
MFRSFATLLIVSLTLYSKGFAANSEPGKQAPSNTQTPPALTPAGTGKTDKTLKNSSKEQTDAELILLSGLPLTKGVEATQSYVRISVIKSDLIEDSTLKQWVRLALSKISDQPESAAAIREEHLIRVGDYYLTQALEAQKLNKIPEAYKIAQIAVRISPGNTKAKLLLANILHNNYGRTEDAVQTLRRGLDYLNITDTLGRDYLDRYFQLLQLVERDDEVIEQSLL